MSNDPVSYDVVPAPTPEHREGVSLPSAGPHDPAQVRAQIGALQAALAQVPGAVFGDSDAFPLTHSFADGVYVREIFLPKGAVLTGKLHRHAHPNFLLRGEVLVVTEHGGREHLKAPLALISPAGTKRAVYALADTVWCTVHLNPDNTRDLAVLEAQIIAPDYAALEATQAAQVIADARADYRAVLAEVGVSHADVRALTEQTDDQIPLPDGSAVAVRPSPLDGLGVFVTHPVQAGEILAPARLGGKRTPVGRYTNHAPQPNCQMVVGPQGIDLVALRALPQGAEALVDYRACRAAAAQYDTQRTQEVTPCPM